MRKLRKLFRDPKLFFKDSKFIKAVTKKKNKQVAIFIGFSTWKKYIRKYFKLYEVIFTDKEIDKTSLEILLRKYRNSKLKIFVWGYKISNENLALLKRKGVSINYVEDGFIRSIELGATKCPPLSLCFDNRAAYFDTTKTSQLENILNNYDFDKDPEIISRSKEIMSSLIESKISKYNNAPHKNASLLYGPKNTKRVLVIGQVEDDASIKYGYRGEITNNELVKLAHFENPEAQIIYKPHPDVLLGYRNRKSDSNDISNICMIIRENISLACAFETIDHVYTITSLSGFEALIRGIKVTTLGDAFYSNWGLTDDRQLNPRKSRKLTKEQLFAAAYIIYPNYYSENTGDSISIEKAIENIKKSIIEKNKNSIELPQKPSHNINYLDEIKFSLKNGDFDKAEKLCNKQWQQTPWDLELSIYMAKIYRKKNNFDSAIYLCEALSSRIKNHRILLELFFSLQERGDKTEKLKNILRLAIKFSPNNSNTARIELIKYIWSYNGIGPELLSECTILGSGNNLNALDNMLLSAIYCETGRYLLAERQYLLAKEKDPNILFKVQYFHLLEHLCLKGYLEGSLEKLINDISYKIDSGTEFFKSLIIKNINSLVIVGNGPSEIGTGNGSLIDEKEIVIRFNAYSTNYPECIDYGNKTDIWVKTGAYVDVPRRNANSLKLIIVSGYNPLHRNTMGVDLFSDFVYSEAHICYIPKFVYEELFSMLGATPSAGLAILYWIYKIIGPINSNQVFGFSFGSQLKHKSEHYFKNKNKVNYTAHLWESESIILKKCINFNHETSVLGNHNE